MQKRSLLIFLASFSLYCCQQKAPEQSEVVGSERSAAAPKDTTHWDTIAGMPLKKKPDLKQFLAGNTFTRIAGKGETETMVQYGTRQMVMCPDGSLIVKATVKEENGATGESLDDGSYEIYVDRQGNQFMQIKLNRSGDGFVQLFLDGKQMVLSGPGGIETFTYTKGGC